MDVDNVDRSKPLRYSTAKTGFYVRQYLFLFKIGILLGKNRDYCRKSV